MTCLGDLPLVAIVRILGVVLQGLWARELVVARRGRADVALACNLSRKASNGARYCESVRNVLISYDVHCASREAPTLVDLAEDDDAREACFGVAWDCGVEDIDAW